MDFTRTLGTRARHWETMTTEQRTIASRIQARADGLREEAMLGGESLGIREAVALAAIQLGLDAPSDDQ